MLAKTTDRLMRSIRHARFGRQAALPICGDGRVEGEGAKENRKNQVFERWPEDDRNREHRDDR